MPNPDQRFRVRQAAHDGERAERFWRAHMLVVRDLLSLKLADIREAHEA